MPTTSTVPLLKHCDRVAPYALPELAALRRAPSSSSWRHRTPTPQLFLPALAATHMHNMHVACSGLLFFRSTDGPQRCTASSRVDAHGDGGHLPWPAPLLPSASAMALPRTGELPLSLCAMIGCVWLGGQPQPWLLWTNFSLFGNNGLEPD
jgi:hypothetical protein